LCLMRVMLFDGVESSPLLFSSRVEVVVVEHQDLPSWISWLILRIE
jgi:hypothetical protein